MKTRTLKKVMLIVPRGGYRGENNIEVVQAPVGLIHLASAIMNCCDLSFTDCNQMNDEEMFRKLRTENPNIIGLSAWIDNFPETKRLLKGLKKRMPKSLLVVGGPYASVAPRLYSEADVVIQGEGIQKMIDLIGAREKIDYANFFNPKIYDRLPMSLYIKDFISLKNCFPIITAWNCRHSCAFCGNGYLQLNMERSLKSVKGELEYLKNNCGINSVYFFDGSFTQNRERARKIADIARILDLKWIAQIRADESTPQLAKYLADCGCRYVSFGLESLSEKLLRSINKGICQKNIYETIDNFRLVGITPIAFVIFGLPGQTNRDAREIISFLREKRLSAFPNTLIPIPRSGIWKKAKKEGIKIDPELLALSISENYYQKNRGYCSVNLSRMSLAEIESAVREIQKNFNFNFAY